LQYGAYRLTSASPPPRSKKEVQDTADQLQASTLGVGHSNLVNDIAATVPLSLWLKREEAKTK
jgi:hypothetical protein